MPMRTRGSDGAGTSQGGDDIPNPPPAPPSLADAIAVLLSATTDNARLLRELAHSTTPRPKLQSTTQWGRRSSVRGLYRDKAPGIH